MAHRADLQVGRNQVTSREQEAGPIDTTLWWEQRGQDDSGHTEEPVLSSHRHSEQDLNSGLIDTWLMELWLHSCPPHPRARQQLGVGKLHPEPVQIISRVEVTPRQKFVVPLETKHGHRATKHQQMSISG